jgi:hypothetical protein
VLKLPIGRIITAPFRGLGKLVVRILPRKTKEAIAKEAIRQVVEDKQREWEEIMEIRDPIIKGSKTSEFRAGVVRQVIGLLVMLGVFQAVPFLQMPEAQETLIQALGGLWMLIEGIVYTVSRTVVKSAALRAELPKIALTEEREAPKGIGTS